MTRQFHPGRQVLTSPNLILEGTQERLCLAYFSETFPMARSTTAFVAILGSRAHPRT